MTVQSDDLSGKAAIVTGSGGVGNIGAVTARVLVERGVRVVLADVAGSQLEETTRALVDDGFEVAACATDISDEEQVKALMAFTRKVFGRLDILDNNAARLALADDTDVMSMSVDVWDKIMGVNARGTMLMCKHALPLMIEGGGGSIINISAGGSQAGDVFATAYATSKGAINTLTKYVATQGAAKGVRCNAITPGLICTPLMSATLSTPVQEIFRSHSLTGRLGQPDDIAEMVAFLASERSRFITGQIISVDGGIFAHVPTVMQVAALLDGAKSGTS
jgi:NAD(P)-dependent dehydrogenase (short-subunit alcohol dehydrogenase family)